MFYSLFNKKIIKTNSDLSPKERLFTVLDEYFSKKGYKLVKSQNKFVRNCNFGYEIIEIHFLSYGHLLDLELFWSKNFWGIEKVYSLINGNTRKFKNEKTIFCDIGNYSKSKSIKQYPIKLFRDSFINSTNLYTDLSINRASRKIINLYNKYVEPFFNEHNNLKRIEQIINQKPNSFCEILSWDEKRLKIGLILSKYINPENYPNVLSLYKSYYEKRNLKNEYVKMIKKTDKFLNENDINEIIEKYSP